LAFGAAAAAATAVIVGASFARAADLPVAPPPMAPRYVPAIYDWSGVYAGLSLGVAGLRDEATETATVLQLAGSQAQVSGIGEVFGGQVGGNYQFGPWVAGVEAWWSKSTISEWALGNTLFANNLERTQSAPRWYATATGRFGYAFQDVLLYGKGGLAWMNVNYTLQTQNAANGGAVVSLAPGIADTRMGFVAGVGLEYGITQEISAKLEYDFMDFGTKSYNFGNLAAIGVGPLPVVPVSFESVTHMVTLQLNYRFYWGGGAHY